MTLTPGQERRVAEYREVLHSLGEPADDYDDETVYLKWWVRESRWTVRQLSLAKSQTFVRRVRELYKADPDRLIHEWPEDERP